MPPPAYASLAAMVFHVAAAFGSRVEATWKLRTLPATGTSSAPRLRRAREARSADALAATERARATPRALIRRSAARWASIGRPVEGSPDVIPAPPAPPVPATVDRRRNDGAISAALEADAMRPPVDIVYETGVLVPCPVANSGTMR